MVVTPIGHKALSTDDDAVDVVLLTVTQWGDASSSAQAAMVADTYSLRWTDEDWKLETTSDSFGGFGARPPRRRVGGVSARLTAPPRGERTGSTFRPIGTSGNPSTEKRWFVLAAAPACGDFARRDASTRRCVGGTAQGVTESLPFDTSQLQVSLPAPAPHWTRPAKPL